MKFPTLDVIASPKGRGNLLVPSIEVHSKI